MNNRKPTVEEMCVWLDDFIEILPAMEGPVSEAIANLILRQPLYDALVEAAKDAIDQYDNGVEVSIYFDDRKLVAALDAIKAAKEEIEKS